MAEQRRRKASKQQRKTPPPAGGAGLATGRNSGRRGSVVQQRLRTLSSGKGDGSVARVQRLGSVFRHESSLKSARGGNPSVVFDSVEGKRLIGASTRGRLLDVLLDLELDPEFADKDFVETFVLTYEYFMTPTELLETLIEFYFPDIPDSLDPMARKLFLRGVRVTRERIVAVMETWVEQDVEDFWYTPGLYHTLMAFVDDAAADTTEPHMLDALFRVSRAVVAAEASSGLKDAPLDDVRSAVSGLPREVRDPASFNVLKISPEVLAQQITLVDHAYYRSVKPTECLWLGPDMAVRELYGPSPNLAAWMDRSFAWADWVWASILNGSSNSERAKLIEHFAAVADACLLLRNFNTSCWIISGLHDNTVADNRLRTVWAKVKPSVKARVEQLKADFLQNGFVHYKKEMEADAELPMVALMAAYKKWFVTIDMSNKDTTADGLINFLKLRDIGTTIRRRVEQVAGDRGVER
ncbi:uncharacterized protein AMSG_09262 [Thecamonas trahens ATCC 50062]|uniref:Uncharacterized protein n=1 Tax=Thecamonas trahens ATCC 50062 TaxID=461836 RepID=A0A0L0DMD9_THETB|nr:hypothetical protein AMSG_09262 [Thecamonas trahens ATCC 50062]KNC53181.1 hypothetical protein AMSG_09262 [Thecamonas trahens ATCC 50062]|eukprot:XP_013754653.1 hypothetical protein AMSG_09262 [Thecamonas trahens ATCC 50062]